VQKFKPDFVAALLAARENLSFEHSEFVWHTVAKVSGPINTTVGGAIAGPKWLGSKR